MAESAPSELVEHLQLSFAKENPDECRLLHGRRVVRIRDFDDRAGRGVVPVQLRVEPAEEFRV